METLNHQVSQDVTPAEAPADRHKVVEPTRVGCSLITDEG